MFFHKILFIVNSIVATSYCRMPGIILIDFDNKSVQVYKVGVGVGVTGQKMVCMQRHVSIPRMCVGRQENILNHFIIIFYSFLTSLIDC